MCGFGGGSSVWRDEASRLLGDIDCGLSAVLSGEGTFEVLSFGGGAAGNLKFCKAIDGLRDVAGGAGVLGAVEMADLLRAGRAGGANSLDGSCMMGGEKPPPASGD